MKPEFRIREVTRYVITRHDHKGTHAVVEVDNLNSAEIVLAGLEMQSDALIRAGDVSVDVLDLSSRARNILDRLEVETINDLRKIKKSDILKLEKAGIQSVKEIISVMRPYGGISEE